MGVAPRANLVSVKVSDDDGNTTVLDVIAGIQFAVDNKVQYGIRVINLSLSSNAAESYRTDPLDAAAEQAWNAGIVVVAAAGNEALTSDGVTFSPANDPWAITVGALDDRGTFSRLDDILAPWSSHGLDAGRHPQAGGARSGRRLISGPGAGERLRSPVPDLHRRHALLQGGRHLDGNGGRLRRRRADARGAPVLVARRVKGALMATLDDVPGAGGVIDVYSALDSGSSWSTNLAPSTMIDPATGLIDWTGRASGGRASATRAARASARAGAGRASAATAGSRRAARSIRRGSASEGSASARPPTSTASRWRCSGESSASKPRSGS
jgi:serine protease AprX